ncbi:ROK family protein [Companilactobacillus bobalius]|uniref:Beta-glucoside kinase n=2 Tax=Companilactobacillus bobalius TaxID=2801451 RepID=A0A202FDL2_9LACO|nr:ROK family protein [Companilactobacillus bobalius]KAE9556919.1 N-acetylmannosamine kinase [Companilactobacillus bobalius]KRK81835.1 sugar kinase and transcription regulator [Companilactobacillus bobalius DSM 19674]OVE98566.1 Beta-glucoside kinase [Companilactobacillus bobalius]GEO58990.1 N-acetylmannosamine kinase [Companilactobacillus paralimentarius]
MSNLGLIDIGGTSIKFAVMKNGQLEKLEPVKTPQTLEEFYQTLTAKVNTMKTQYQITGVGISSPGAVNKKTGVVEGASAIPYIHNFEIQQALSERFDLPVSMENDANCAALAELDSGAGKDVSSLLFLIIGTGVGGSVIINHQIWHGAHLFGGEFGFTLVDNKNTLSNLATSVGVAQRYNANSKPVTNYSGKEVFDLADHGDARAQKEVQTMYYSLAKGIYNLQYSFDPELIVLGGAVSNNPHLIPEVEKEVEKIRKVVKIASIKPEIVPCHYTDESNLRGAAVDFAQTYSKGEA